MDDHHGLPHDLPEYVPNWPMRPKARVYKDGWWWRWEHACPYCGGAMNYGYPENLAARGVRQGSEAFGELPVSGGSYNYLYEHTRGLEAQREDIEAMRDRLQDMADKRVPGAARAVYQTRMVLNHLKLAEQHALALKGVWHAVEWRDSLDYSDAEMHEALKDYEGGE